MKWRKSTFSNGGDSACVEMARTDGGIAVRDSKDPNGPVLNFNKAELTAFLLGAKAGEFDDLAL